MFPAFSRPPGGLRGRARRPLVLSALAGTTNSNNQVLLPDSTSRPVSHRRSLATAKNQIPKISQTIRVEATRLLEDLRFFKYFGRENNYWAPRWILGTSAVFFGCVLGNKRVLGERVEKDSETVSGSSSSSSSSKMINRANLYSCVLNPRNVGYFDEAFSFDYDGTGDGGGGDSGGPAFTLSVEMRRAAMLLAPIQHHVYCWLQARASGSSLWLEKLTSIGKDGGVIDGETGKVSGIYSPGGFLAFLGRMNPINLIGSLLSSLSSGPSENVAIIEEYEKEMKEIFKDNGRGTSAASNENNLPNSLINLWDQRGYLTIKRYRHADWVDEVHNPLGHTYGHNIGTHVNVGYPQYSFEFLDRFMEEMGDVGVVKIDKLFPIEEVRRCRDAFEVRPLVKGPYDKMKEKRVAGGKCRLLFCVLLVSIFSGPYDKMKEKRVAGGKRFGLTVGGLFFEKRTTFLESAPLSWKAQRFLGKRNILLESATESATLYWKAQRKAQHFLEKRNGKRNTFLKSATESATLSWKAQRKAQHFLGKRNGKRNTFLKSATESATLSWRAQRKAQHFLEKRNGKRNTFLESATESATLYWKAQRKAQHFIGKRNGKRNTFLKSATESATLYWKAQRKAQHFLEKRNGTLFLKAQHFLGKRNTVLFSEEGRLFLSLSGKRLLYVPPCGKRLLFMPLSRKSLLFLPLSRKRLLFLSPLRSPPPPQRFAVRHSHPGRGSHGFRPRSDQQPLFDRRIRRLRAPQKQECFTGFDIRFRFSTE